VTAYWILFAIWAAGAIQFARRQYQAYNRAFYITVATLTALMIGLRYDVGGDWFTYLHMYETIAFQTLGPALTTTDPGYAILNWISAGADWGIWFPNLGCGILFMAGLSRLAWRQPNPWLAVLVAVPYLIIVVAMGYTRQAAAIGIICWAVADASPKRLGRLVLTIAFAALFHKTAILFLPILLIPVLVRSPLLGIIGAIAFSLLFNIFLGSTSDDLVNNYVNSDYNSQGAAIRVAMNVVAAIIMLSLRDRLGLNDFAKSFWTNCSILSILCVFGLLIFSASSGVDRIALFLIPLQVVTFSRIPYALSTTGRPQLSGVLAVIGYSFAVQFVWLNFGDNAALWKPYDTVLMTDDIRQ